MFRKILAIAILCSMTLHALGRLGVIAYTYAHRFEIAFAIGLSQEKEISVCRSDHYQRTQLISDQKETNHPEIALAHEIQLFFYSSEIRISASVEVLRTAWSNWVERSYKNLPTDIFHPPGAFC